MVRFAEIAIVTIPDTAVTLGEVDDFYDPPEFATLAPILH